jgi:hypothetical protein
MGFIGRRPGFESCVRRWQAEPDEAEHSSQPVVDPCPRSIRLLADAFGGSYETT